jgi:hypothetical protein
VVEWSSASMMGSLKHYGLTNRSVQWGRNDKEDELTNRSVLSSGYSVNWIYKRIDSTYIEYWQTNLLQISSRLLETDENNLINRSVQNQNRWQMQRCRYRYRCTTDQFIKTDDRSINELTTDQFINAGKKDTSELTTDQFTDTDTV